MINPLNLLQTIIYVISSSLFYPVMALLVILSGWTIIAAGGILAEWIKRKQCKTNVDITHYLEDIQRKKTLPEELIGHLPQTVCLYTEKLTSLVKKRDIFFHEKVEALIQEKELALTKEVDKTRFIIRTGPSLGLMGTLIPMGTGLASLSQGDMAQITSSLIVAFTTTVVGLALGIIAYFFTIVKGHWVQDDLRNIELITESMTRETLYNDNSRFNKNEEILYSLKK
jgi:biopolymer transport protein ExbB/TolQ